MAINLTGDTHEISHSTILPLVTPEFREYDYVKVHAFRNDFPMLLRHPKDDPLITYAQVFNRSTGEWEVDPDKWHKIVDFEEEPYEAISPEEAMESSLNASSEVVDFCDEICQIAHSGQTDKCGKPYYLHPQAVAKACDFPLAKAVAYLHDVIEDTRIDEHALEAMLIPKPIIKRVVLLTKKDGVEYMDYIREVSKDPVASEVKYRDLKHNTDLTRTDGKVLVSEEKWSCYQQALRFLNDKYHFE